MAYRADYHKGLDSHFEDKERSELAQLHSEHGEASMHPMDRYKHQHVPKKVRPMSLKDSHKAGRLKIKKK